MLTKANWQDENDSRDYITVLEGELEIFQALLVNIDRDFENNLSIFKATLNRE